MRTALFSGYTPKIILLLMFCGGLVGFCSSFFHRQRTPGKIVVRPLPHHFPKYPDGVTLRFAMVHDVIHERFPVHGSAYYEERNRRVRQALDMYRRHNTEYFALLDDLGVGLVRLGHHEEAVQLMRDKLAEQIKLGFHRHDLYSSYANLGTFLILWQLAEGFDDKGTARKRIQESIDLIHKAVEVYPESHFGREAWQVVIEEFLLASLDDRDLVLRFDMVGNRLDADIDPKEKRCLNNPFHWVQIYGRLAHLQGQGVPKEDAAQEVAKDARGCITLVGAEKGWPDAVKSQHTSPVPFDEPTLGIIGMWRYGAGANPHFALPLGEIMMRVGQRYIAWCAYERAADLGKGLGPDYVAHCRRRQRIIEQQLPADEVVKLRPRFHDELAHGRRFQQDYQEYEAGKIKEGASIDDPHFYDAFFAEKGEIASPIGAEDTFTVEPDRGFQFPPPERQVAWALLGGGLLAFPFALFSYYRARAKRVAASNETAHDESVVGQDD